MCIDSALRDGLAIDAPPAPAMRTPKSNGNKAVTYPVVAKKAIPNVLIIAPIMMDS